MAVVSYPVLFYVMFGVWAPLPPAKRALYYAAQHLDDKDAENFRDFRSVTQEWKAYDDADVHGKQLPPIDANAALSP